MDLSNIKVNTQSSIRIEGEKILYFDPINIENENHDADIIFITHEHFDHFDPKSVAKLKNENTVLIAPASMEKQIRAESGVANIELWEPGANHACAGLSIDTIPAYNMFPKPFHTKSKNWQGYLVKMDGVSYYVAGDTDVNDDIKKVSCDVALIPIGVKFTMDKMQAVNYIMAIKPKAVIPTHYGEIVGNPADGSEFKKDIEAADGSIQVELKL